VALQGDFRAEFLPRFPCVVRQIPYSTEQGISYAQQGIFHLDVAGHIAARLIAGADP
jgi:hypothetical protein